MQVITTKYNINEITYTKYLHHQPSLLRTHRKPIVICLATISIVLILGYILSNISMPIVSMGSIFDPIPVYKNGKGAINGYVISPSEISTLGTIIIAAEQGGLSKTTTVGLSSDGKYVFENLNPGKYVVIAYLSNGKYRVLENIQVGPDTVQTLIFKL
jgi:hypothetical protein